MMSRLYKLSLNSFVIISILSFSVFKNIFPGIYYMKYFLMVFLCFLLLIRRRNVIKIKYFHIYMYILFSINFIVSLVINQEITFVAFFDYINLILVLTYVLLIFPI